ncbi:hypothetical protein QM996_32685 (plasmid) [Sinorhizobium chiapasense]
MGGRNDLAEQISWRLPRRIALAAIPMSFVRVAPFVPAGTGIASPRCATKRSGHTVLDQLFDAALTDVFRDLTFQRCNAVLKSFNVYAILLNRVHGYFSRKNNAVVNFAAQKCDRRSQIARLTSSGEWVLKLLIAASEAR